MKKIKVALFLGVANDRNYDGATMSVYTVLDLLPKDKIEFLIVTSKAPKDPKEFPYKYLTEPSVELPLYKDYPISFPQLSPSLRKNLDKFSPDIIHITTPFFSGPWALNYAKKRKLPVLTIYHTHFLAYIEYYVGKYKPIFKLIKTIWERHFRKFYNEVDIALIPTTTIQDELEKLGVNSEKMHTWGRGINLEIFNPKAKNIHKQKNVIQKNKKNIFFVSRLVWEKELETLIGVYKQLSKSRNDVNFIIAGDGPQRQHLEMQMPKATFLGKQSHKELSYLYASSDVFVFPSVTETFGNVVQEAMACGCPPVVAAAGGPKGIVKDGVNGLHAKPKDVDDFVRKITRLLDDKELRNTLSANAAKYAKEQSWQKLAEKLLEHYKSLL